MNKDLRVRHGTLAWFAMVGSMMVEAAEAARLPPDLELSLVERYIDAAELAPGLLQGLRFAIHRGHPSFRVGAYAGERGDITIEVSAAGSLALNTMPANDPSFAPTLQQLQRDGALRIDGDLARLGAWFAAVHDRIVARTAPGKHS